MGGANEDAADRSRSARRRAAWAVFLWPLIITATSLVWTFSFLDELPETVVTHWGTGGVADGFTSREAAPWYALIGLVMGWALGALVIHLARRDAMARRLGVGMSAGTAAFVSGTIAVTLWHQRGPDGTADISSVDMAITLSLVVALVLGFIAAWTVPGLEAETTTATGPVPADAPRVNLRGRGTASWSGTARPARGIWLLLVLLPLAFVGLAALTRTYAFMVFSGGLVMVLVVAFSFYRVEIGEEGLAIRGLLGRPMWRIPLSDVEYAGVTTVDPLWQFGGWGYRIGTDGRTGFVVRKGEALEVTRGDGARWLITVDGAEEAAGLLNTLAERVRP
ncbi:DUF1648 domain-containing protein [Nostocoides sp. F2B08]|uniref:DUF1648 domain-containing protein n=1 Tax=Nostocoides sp. F2B08 TaxID=2653936 RepID=UPI0012631CD2|nr:DUF1648 domain-containing protein [Tetrasphaera sp. F2B08]KAB7746236.1 DUF1648 domain-containing protein [Tetrasphaera sp. F2B08]